MELLLLVLLEPLNGSAGLAYAITAEISRNCQLDGRLDVAIAERDSLADLDEVGGDATQLFEEVAGDVVHDVEALARDAEIGLDVLHDPRDVKPVGLDPLPAPEDGWPQEAHRLVLLKLEGGDAGGLLVILRRGRKELEYLLSEGLDGLEKVNQFGLLRFHF